MKKFECGNKIYNLPDQACVFCDHCTDMFYDSKGVHMIFCDKQLKYADFGNCPPLCKQFEG